MDELELALEDARHEISHLQFDLEATRRERDAANLCSIKEMVRDVGGIQNVAAVVILRRDMRAGKFWKSDADFRVFIQVNGANAYQF